MEPAALSYTNRKGVTDYLHETRTERGATRYVTKLAAEGALTVLPKGYEVVENVNGKVSVRARRPRQIPRAEEQRVKRALKSHGREGYRVEVKGRAIIIHQPDYDAEEVAELFDPARGLGVLSGELDKLMRQQVGDAAWEDYRRQKKKEACERLRRLVGYSPVMHFRLEDAEARLFSVERMCHRGEGGWLNLAHDMALDMACDYYVPLLGTDELFEEI
jgi:hypothetical protein